VGGALRTWNWLPPEALQEEEGGSEIQYDERLDVYSFGIVMWEIVTRKYPFEEDYAQRFQRGRFFDDRACRNAVINDHLRPPIDPNTPLEYCTEKEQWNKYCEILSDCWRHHPSERPKFSDILKRLESLSIPGESSRKRLQQEETVVGSEYIQEVTELKEEDSYRDLRLVKRVILMLYDRQGVLLFLTRLSPLSYRTFSPRLKDLSLWLACLWIPLLSSRDLMCQQPSSSIPPLQLSCVTLVAPPCSLLATVLGVFAQFWCLIIPVWKSLGILLRQESAPKVIKSCNYQCFIRIGCGVCFI
jgi:serine/threonine protein kinase